MEYSIGEVAQKMNLPVHTLRYYDSEGLLPFVERSENGRRVFHDRDIILLNTIDCLKSTGMQIKEIRKYVDWCVEGFSSVPNRYEMMLQRKVEVEEQIKEMQKMLRTINKKCEFYKDALVVGNTDMCAADREKWAEDILDNI